MALPLGLRTNNPGNIRYSPSINWKGQVGSENGFAKFSDMLFGIRAYGINVKGKINKGYNTLDKLISLYAPPSENNTDAYINSVSKSTGFSRNQKLTPDSNTLFKLARAMFSVELGANYAAKITDNDILKGLSLSGGGAISSTTALGGGAILLLIIVISLLTFK